MKLGDLQVASEWTSEFVRAGEIFTRIMDAGRNETMKHSWRMKTAVLVFGFSN
jgi:hypothetical protein